MAETTWEDSVAEIWALFKETDAKFKETDARFKETDAQFKETDARLAEQFAETDRKITRLEGILGMQWGRLMEALVQPGLLKLFQQRNIEVRYVSQRIKAHVDGETMEIDLLLENGLEMVAVEVKTRFGVREVDEFLNDLDQLTHFFPRYKDNIIYGAIASLEMPASVSRYAYKKGLFVLTVEGEGLVQLKNDAKFQPKNFA
jgi:hypothetical protein